jgi:hypothetical protein
VASVATSSGVAFGLVAGVDAEFAAGVGAEQSFIDGFAEDHRQQAGDVGDAFLGEGVAQGFHPGLDCHPLYLAECHVGEAGQDVVAQVGVVGVPGDGADLVGLRPHLNPLAHGGMGEAGVDEEFSSLIGLHVRCALLGVRAAGEAALGEQGTVG